MSESQGSITIMVARRTREGEQREEGEREEEQEEAGEAALANK